MEAVKIFCSVVIPTVNRSSLARAIESVLSQQSMDDCYEIIVVNDSGEPLLAADWQEVSQVQIVHTNRHERSVARNTGAAVARGRYLCFLDDDDYLLPDALQNFWHLSQSSDAAWLYGGTQIVDRQAKPLLQLHHGLNGNSFLPVLAGEWIPLQASLIRAEAFFAVGGFNPLLTGPEDIDLLRRIALRYDVAETQAVVACVAMGEEGSTTDYDHHPERSRWAREMILAEPAVFKRMQAKNGFWHGRIVRIYLTSAVWNMHHKRWLTAVSRATHAYYALARSGSTLLAPSFWQSVLKPYHSETFARGQRAAGVT